MSNVVNMGGLIGKKNKKMPWLPEIAVLEAIYEAAGDETKWGDAFSLIASRIESVGSMYSLFSMGTSPHGFKTEFVSGHGHSVEIGEKYMSEVSFIDPHVPLGLRTPAQSWFLSHEHFSQEYVRWDAFFQEIMKPMGIRWMAGTRLWESETFTTALAFHRAYDASPFSEKAMQTLAMLTPHLSRASRLNTKLITHKMNADLGMAALNNVSFGIAIFQENGRIVFSNTVAEKLLADRDIFTLELSGRMGLRNKSSQQQLQCALVNALQLQSTAMILVDRVGKPVIYALMLPLPPASRWNTLWQRPLAMLAMRHIYDSTDTSGQMLSFLFKLTQAEQHLTQYLLTGQSLDEYATLRGVSKETVRSQLKSIFAKTGTRRQAELVALLGRLPSVG